jgi:hypothetical protein
LRQHSEKESKAENEVAITSLQTPSNASNEQREMCKNETAKEKEQKIKCQSDKISNIRTTGLALHIGICIPNLQAISFISRLDATAGIPHKEALHLTSPSHWIVIWGALLIAINVRQWERFIKLVASMNPLSI